MHDLTDFSCSGQRRARPLKVVIVIGYLFRFLPELTKFEVVFKLRPELGAQSEVAIFSQKNNKNKTSSGLGSSQLKVLVDLQRHD